MPRLLISDIGEPYPPTPVAPPFPFCQIPDRCILLERRAKISRKNAALICSLRLFLLGEGRDGHYRRDY